jgi:hypothetical protein
MPFWRRRPLHVHDSDRYANGFLKLNQIGEVAVFIEKEEDVINTQRKIMKELREKFLEQKDALYDF